MYSLVLGTLLWTFTPRTTGDHVTRTDICTNSGKFLKCDSNFVLKIKDVICMPNNYTCPEKDKIVSICEGQRSCESIGLRQQLWTYCQDQPSRTVLVDYSCESVDDNGLCRTNLCSDQSRGLLCPPKSSIHVTDIQCGSDSQRCPWNLHHVIYPTCEGKSECHASGLRMLGLEKICRVHSFVIADYICVQNSVVHDTCTGYTKRLPSRFGVIKSPGYPMNPNGNPNGCVWRIPLGLGQRIDVTIHLAYSREETEGSTCSAKFLHVRYVDCRSHTTVTEYFCQTHEVNISRQSCGDVTVQSYSYFKGEDRGNRFLVSYEVVVYDAKGRSYVPYILPCGGSSGNSFYASSKDVQDGGYLSSNDSTSGNGTVIEYSLNPEKFSLILIICNEPGPLNTLSSSTHFTSPSQSTEIVMINFLLFILAFILVVSICLVCYKTRQMDRQGDYQISKDGEKAGTSKQNGVEEETKVLLRESNETTVSNKASNYYPGVQNRNTYDGIYNEIKSEDLPGAQEIHLRKKKDPYASYDSLDFDSGVGADMVGGRRYSARCSAEVVVSSNLPPTPPQTPQEQNTVQYGIKDNQIIVGEDGVPHVKINNDFYAIVQKSKSLPNGTGNSHPASSFEVEPHDKQVNGTTGGPFSSSGVLPQHDCMLHNDAHCNIPPFPNLDSYDNLHLDNIQSSSTA